MPFVPYTGEVTSEKPTGFVEYTGEVEQRRPEDVGFLEGAGAAVKRGFESYGDVGAGLGLAGLATTGQKEAAARKMREIKEESKAPKEAPAMSWADFERIAEEKGVAAALKEAPKYIAEQVLSNAPQMAGPLAVGAGVGAVSGPLGVVTGPLAGIATYGVQQFGNFLVRQAQEKNDPEELEVAKAALTAAGTAPLGYFVDRFTAGIGGKSAAAVGKEAVAELAKRGVAVTAAAVAKSGAKGAGKGILAESPTEVVEQVAERYQAGLPLTGDEAMKEYKEAFAGAAAAGGGIGGTSAAVRTGQQISEAKKFVPYDGQIEPVKTVEEVPTVEPIKPMASEVPAAETPAETPAAPPVTPPAETAPPAEPAPVEQTPAEPSPVEPPAAPEKPPVIKVADGKIKGVEEINLSPDQLKLSKDVPQFKEDADEMGVVEPLQGEEYDYIGTPPIQVWRRLNGDLEIISGRHRWDLAKRTGASYIPTQVFDEAKGFNSDMAAIMDAELNIRDGKGKVTDFVNYFTVTGDKYGLTEKDYKSRGLLDRPEGKRAYTITVQGSDDLIQSLRSGQVKEDTAYRIAEAAPNDSRLQALGLKLVNEKPLPQAINILHAAKTIKPQQQDMGGPLDLFGFDDSGMKLAEDMGKIATEKQRSLSEQIKAIEGPGKKSEIAKKYGINVEDPAAIKQKVKDLKAERAAWDNWASNPELVDQIRRELSGEVIETVPTEAKPAKAKSKEPVKAKAEEKPAEVTVESVKMRRDPMGTDYLVTLSDGRTAAIYKSDPGGDFGLGAWHIDTKGYKVPVESQRGHVSNVLGYKKDEAVAAVAKKLDELEKYKIDKPKSNVLTAAFKKWFGKSVVKNSVGDPLIVYHGTVSDISEFEPSIEGRLGAGIYFTPDAEAASRFSQRDEIRSGEDKARNVIPVYLKIENLLDEDNITNAQAKALLKAIPKTVDEVIALGYPADLANSVREQMQKELDNWRKELQEHGEFSSQMLSYTLQGGPISVVEKIYKKAGFDGITRISTSLKGYDKGFREYLVFRPDQIKSAIGSGYTEGIGDITANFQLEPEQKQTAAEKKAATERENKEIADREAEFFTLTPRTPEQGAGNYLQQDMIGAMGLTEAEFKKGIDKKSTEPGEPLILRDVTMSEQETYNDDANAKVDDEIIDYYKGMDTLQNASPKDDIELTYGKEEVEKTLNKQAQAVEDYINLASQGKVTAEEFMKTVREAAAKGEITPDVLNAIEHIYKTSPAVLDGIRIEMSSGKKRTGKYLEIGHYQPLARMIRLFKDTSGVSDPSTVRHEIAHTMEQMMTPEQKRMVIRAWRDELMRATRAETTDAGHIFFQNVAKFLHDPKLSTYKAVIKSMPNETYYQYVNPSEYWAVNAEEILKSREAGSSGLKSMVEKLHEGLKQSFGMSNFWVGNKVFDQILTGDRFSPRMLINYIRATKHRNYAGNKAPLATWDIMGSNWLEDWKYNYVDKNIDLKRVQEDISRMTGDVADEVDPYARESLSHSRISTRMEEFVRDYVNKLADVMKANGISQQQLHEYLLARHAPEYNRVVGGRNPTMGDLASSISTKDAQDYIRSLGDARVEKLNKAAQIVDAMTQKTRNILVDEGYEEASTIEAWEKQFQFYVPFLRKDIEYKGGGVGGGSSKGRGKFAQMAAGSLKEVDDIGKNVVMQHLQAIEKVEDARVRRALFGLAVKNPNPEFWMPIDPSAMKNPEKTRQILERMGLNEELINNLMQPPKAPKMNNQTGLVEYVTSDVISKSKNVVAVRIDGHQVYLVLNGSNPRANRLAQSIQNMDTKSLEGYLRASAYVTRWFAQVNTQWNPVFGLWNFARDIQGAGLNLSTTQLRGHEKEVLKGAFTSARQIFVALREQRKTGNRATTPGAEDFYDLGLSGGTTGFKAKFVDPTREKNLLQEAVKDLDRGKPMKIAKYFSDAISDWNDMLENGVRLSAYKVALANGLSKQQAATIAKNLTVNFNRKGAKSQNAGALYAFFNASVQGTARLYETLKGPIGKKIMYGGAMLGFIQSGMMALAGFEDDEPPEFVKEKNIIVPLGWITGEKSYLSFPMPLGFNVFPGIGRIVGETLIGAKKGDDIGKKKFDVLSLVANSFNPLGSTGFSLQTIMPTPLDPFAAISQNKDAFGRPIYKADRETNPQVGYKRTRETTWDGWKAIAEFINYAQGGTQDTKGAFKAFDLTGDEISFLAGQATGGVGRDVMKTFGLAKDFVTGDETPTYKIPLIGKLYGNAESQAAAKNRFYANVTKLAELEARVKGMKERKENVSEFRREHPETQVMDMANRIENDITQLNKRRGVLIKNGASVEQIKRIEDIKQKKMEQLNNRYNMLRKQ